MEVIMKVVPMISGDSIYFTTYKWDPDMESFIYCSSISPLIYELAKDKKVKVTITLEG